MRRTLGDVRKIPGVLRALGFTLLIQTSAHVAWAQTGAVFGHVVDRNGNPLPYVAVTVKGTALWARTNLAGEFRIPNVPFGSYTVVARAAGYFPEEQSNVAVESRSSTPANSALRIFDAHDYLDPLRTYKASPDSVLQLTILSASGETVRLLKRRGPPPWVEVTLRNSGPDTVVLVSPGDVWRTPLIKWTVWTADGMRAAPVTGGYCGNRGPLTEAAIFTLGPGQSRRFRLGFPAEYPYQRGSYQIRLAYENRPSMLGGEPLGEDDPEAVRQLHASTPCKLTSNALAVKIK